ncbi:hypothetical protein [Rhodococcus qingshengii]|uniref:hypothetical protein n=1 Tax=Rhodococcus qingshengii TaxID=334542 RepID=UPI002943A794|nr:hypothetical protein [Rhodococcus qingshengii]WOI85978.1 hypothetical protein R0122_22630 [Rhodococcus qingshengii]
MNGINQRLTSFFAERTRQYAELDLAHLPRASIAVVGRTEAGSQCLVILRSKHDMRKWMIQQRYWQIESPTFTHVHVRWRPANQAWNHVELVTREDWNAGQRWPRFGRWLLEP